MDGPCTAGQDKHVNLLLHGPENGLGHVQCFHDHSSLLLCDAKSHRLSDITCHQAEILDSETQT